MLRSLIITLTLIAATQQVVNANSASFFQYNKKTAANETAQLTCLENYVAANSGTTLSQLQAAHRPLINNMQFGESTILSSVSVDGPLGIPSFLWGFVLGTIGIVITYLVTSDSEETKKAAYGCILQPVVLVLAWFIFIIIEVHNGF